MIGMKKEKENIRCLCDTARIRNVITRRNVSSDVVISLSESRMNKEAAVILSPEVGVKISGASVEPVVCDGIKTNRYSAQRDLYTHSLRSGFKMTKDTLFAKVACLWRLPRSLRSLAMTVENLRFPLLRLAINPFIIALLFFLNISVSYAEKCIGSTGKTEITNEDCQTCGANCDWEIIDGKLSITGTGKMKNWSSSEATDCPWYGKSITSVEIGSGITSIGKHAFSGTTLTSITIPDTITSVATHAFCGSTKHLTELIIPDTWADGNVALGNLFYKTCFATPYADDISRCANAKIVCQGDAEKCKKALVDVNGNCASNYCVNLDKIVAANYTQCSGNYFWNGARCVREPDVSKRKCCDSCKDMGGWCNRIRYTPAEAAAVLKDDSTNAVTLTFRK